MMNSMNIQTMLSLVGQYSSPNESLSFKTQISRSSKPYLWTRNSYIRSTSEWQPSSASEQCLHKSFAYKAKLGTYYQNFGS